MTINTHFSIFTPIFQGLKKPEEGLIIGYSAIIESLQLPIPIQFPIALVSNQNRSYQNTIWKVFSKSYLPEDHEGLSEIEALYKHLVFALKYEGVNLLVFSFLTQHYSHEELLALVSIEPTGQYSRRIWFLIEWIMGEELKGKDALTRKSYVTAIDEKHQYAIKGVKSPRHLVINNLPGSRDFCPLIKKTKKLEDVIKENLSEIENQYISKFRKDILQRASSFLMLKDSKASFTIEGESPKSKRAARWGQAIGQSGSKELNKDELVRLQQIVIENPRFIKAGYRKKGGFVGEHDRHTGEPIPEHISAKWVDLDRLMDGWVESYEKLINSELDAVLLASIIAFGFVFIHPFEDGNGRIHRYLIHHILAKKQFSQQGMVFPVSASMLNHIDDYRKTLEAYSQPLLDFIEWKETKDHNIEVLNNTIDYYRYFDATPQAEFLYDAVKDTINHIIPEEVSFLIKYDEFKRYIDDEYEMPDHMVALLVRFLDQNDGKLSKRAQMKEFVGLSNENKLAIEEEFERVFG